MRTANQMYEYCKRNKMGATYSNRRETIKSFELVENGLCDNEYVLTCFLANTENKSGLGVPSVYAISNQRIMIARKKLIGREFQTISLDNVNDIFETYGLICGRIVIDTLKETVVICVNRNRAKRIGQIIHNIIQKTKEERSGREAHLNIIQKQECSADELWRYKQLLDAGVISDEEFETKKKQILGL